MIVEDFHPGFESRELVTNIRHSHRVKKISLLCGTVRELYGGNRSIMMRLLWQPILRAISCSLPNACFAFFFYLLIIIFSVLKTLQA